MKLKLILYIIISPIMCWAQFEPEEVVNEESAEVSSSNVDISRAEIKKLAEAKKSKSEAGLLSAAAEILSKDPNHLLTLNALGIHYFETKKYGLAKIIFKRALKASPEEPALYNNLGIVYLAEEDLRSALENFKKSTDLKSNYKIGLINLSSIYLEYRDFKRSLAPLEEAYKATRSDIRRGDANAIDIANNYAVALMGVDESGKAQGIYEDIYEANVRNPIPFLNYAILLVEVQKKKKDAFRVLSKLKFMTEDKEILRLVDELEGKLE